MKGIRTIVSEMLVQDGGEHEGLVEELSDALFVRGDAYDAVVREGTTG